MSESKCQVRSLSVHMFSSGLTTWTYKAIPEHYGSPATLAEVSAPGFFDEAVGMLTRGDMIMVSATDGGRIVYVAKSDGKRVVVAPLS